MIKLSTFQIWIGISLAWPPFWILVFDRWFLFSPLGLIITFVTPLAGWFVWWKFYEGNGERLLAEMRQFAGRSAETLHRLKKQAQKKRADNQQ